MHGLVRNNFNCLASLFNGGSHPEATYVKIRGKSAIISSITGHLLLNLYFYLTLSTPPLVLTILHRILGRLHCFLAYGVAVYDCQAGTLLRSHTSDLAFWTFSFCFRSCCQLQRLLNPSVRSRTSSRDPSLMPCWIWNSTRT